MKIQRFKRLEQMMNNDSGFSIVFSILFYFHFHKMIAFRCRRRCCCCCRLRFVPTIFPIFLAHLNCAFSAFLTITYLFFHLWKIKSRIIN